MNRRCGSCFFAIALAAGIFLHQPLLAQSPPNIVLIYADDK